jgi:hypothetical protein
MSARYEGNRSRLDENFRLSIQHVDADEIRYIEETLKKDFPESDRAAFAPWPDEPQKILKLRNKQWEYPLKTERGAIVAFCDMYCRYAIGFILTKTNITNFLIEQTQISDRKISHDFIFSKTQPETQHVGWEQRFADLHVFFEVKTEIPSIGELMRQLQTYRAMPALQPYDNNRPLLIVVAPPHNEAASVCREHGIPFVEYRPD